MGLKERLHVFQAAARVAVGDVSPAITRPSRPSWSQRQFARKNASIKIQSWIRGNVQRRAYRQCRAATRIQAFARGIAPRLRHHIRKLEHELQVIEQKRKADIMLLQLSKWREMESLRNQLEEQRKKFAEENPQIVIDTLKEENSKLEEEISRLQSMQLQMKMMREMTDQTLRVQNHNFETVQSAVNTLNEKFVKLTRKQERYEEQIDLRTGELEELGARINYETTLRQAREKTVNGIVELVEARCEDETLVDIIVAMSNGEYPDEEGHELFEVIEEEEIFEEEESMRSMTLHRAFAPEPEPERKVSRTASGFELSFALTDFEDDISVLGDSTHHAADFPDPDSLKASNFTGLGALHQDYDDDLSGDEFMEEIIEEETVGDEDESEELLTSDESSVYVENHSIIL